MKHPDDGMTFEDKRLEVDDGVFSPVNDGRLKDCDDKDECAPDDIVEDPVNDQGVPGTVDDLPYDYGVETPVAADEELFVESPTTGWGGVGDTGYDPDGTPSELGADDERELWGKQRALIDEDERESARGLDLDEAETAATERAYAGDAADPLPMNPDGVSAVGDSSPEEE